MKGAVGGQAQYRFVVVGAVALFIDPGTELGLLKTLFQHILLEAGDEIGVQIAQ